MHMVLVTMDLTGVSNLVIEHKSQARSFSNYGFNRGLKPQNLI